MRRIGAAIAAACRLFASPAAAQFPDKPIRLIVPQAPGSATDTVARILGAELAKELGQQIVVDNRPGGALTIGLDLTAKSEPDGYTLCMGPIGALAITRHMVAKLPYDIERDFQPIALVARGHMLLAAAPDAPFKTMPELIDYAKANPGKLSNASSSNGSPGHVGGELFKFMTGTDIVHIPYRGGAAATNDLIAGRVQLMFESLNSIASHARSGTVRALAVTGERRSPGIPGAADRRRGRRAGLCGADLERRDRPGGHPAPDRRQAQRGDQPRHQVAGIQGALCRDRGRACGRNAGGFRGGDPRRLGEVARRGAALGREAGLVFSAHSRESGNPVLSSFDSGSPLSRGRAENG